MNIVLLLGGTSAERDVSIASGLQVKDALRQKGHSVVIVDLPYGIVSEAQESHLRSSGVKSDPPDTDGLASSYSRANVWLEAAEVSSADIVFLALHGGSGENGTMQAFLDLMEIPYTGSGHQGSANAMDKDISKRLFRLADIPTPEWIMLPAESVAIERKIGFPAVIKANKQGSSVGLTIVRQKDDLASAVEEAFRYDEEAMAERFIAGRELTVGILDDRALAVGEIIPRRSYFFDYASKYQVGGAKEIFPADLSADQTATIRKLAVRAHRALKLQGYSRVDFKLDNSGRFWCLEANTLPGMTATSLLPQSAAAVGISFSDLCERICKLGIRRFGK